MTGGAPSPAAMISAIDGLVGLPPEIGLRTAVVTDVDPAVVAVVLASSAEGGPTFDAVARGVGSEFGLDLDLLVESESLRGEAGSVLVVPLARSARPTRLLVVGIGAGAPGDWRAAGASLARRAGAAGRLAVVADPDDPGLRALVEGLALGSYRSVGLLDRAGQPKRAAVATAAGDGPVRADPTSMPATDVQAATGAQSATDVQAATGAQAAAGRDASGGEVPVLAPADPAVTVAPADVVVLTARAGEPAALAAMHAARAVALGVYIARDLVNTPSLIKSPEWLADRAVRIATAAGLTASVLGPDDLAAQGFGGLRAVGEGSPRPPCLVRLEYDGPPGTGVAGAGRAAGDTVGTAAGSERDEAVRAGAAGSGSFGAGHRVLVGKGITFDSGGLSLKPPVPMIGMKTDMSGAAAVLGAMTALPALRAPGRVTGLLCLAENMIGAAAMRPGDVITCWGGTTVEVLNTDAEGRLVLADGLAYAAGELDADVIVDLATLTGAISVALGRRTAGLFSSDDDLAAALSAAADSAGERVWRLPLVEEYRPAIDSPVADLANIGRALDVGGGSITAALFLREFAGSLPWAHLDIAGTARSDSDDGEISRGGTGWGVRTLLSWLSGEAAAAPVA